jgi:hypothetical protein
MVMIHSGDEKKPFGFILITRSLACLLPAAPIGQAAAGQPHRYTGLTSGDAGYLHGPITECYERSAPVSWRPWPLVHQHLLVFVALLP